MNHRRSILPRIIFWMFYYVSVHSLILPIFERFMVKDWILFGKFSLWSAIVIWDKVFKNGPSKIRGSDFEVTKQFSSRLNPVQTVGLICIGIIHVVCTQKFQKSISYPLIHTRTFTYEGVKSINFSESFAYLLNDPIMF